MKRRREEGFTSRDSSSSLTSDEALARRLQEEEEKNSVRMRHSNEDADAALARLMEAEEADASTRAREIARQSILFRLQGGMMEEEDAEDEEWRPRPRTRGRRNRRRGGDHVFGMGGGMLDHFIAAIAAGVGAPPRLALPPGVDPRLAQLMTRDLTANDYELLGELDDGGNNKKVGATSSEINRMPVFEYNGSRSTAPPSSSSGSSSNVVDLVTPAKSDVVDLVDSKDKASKSPEDADENGDNQCCICLENFASMQKLMRLPCLHCFHIECGKNWLEIKASCPICNHGI